MTVSRVLRFFLALASASLGLCAAGCATTDAPSRPAPAVKRVVQLHFGQEAVFAVCVEPACPAVTPKTLDTTAPAAAPSAAPGSASPQARLR
jgi:hypothetical protein